MPTRNRRVLLLPLTLLVLVPTALAAQVAADKLSIHGFFNQAYAASTDQPINGIPKGETSDYRTAAVQLGYDLSSADRLVIQLRSRRLGTSLLNASESDVTLAWAFYERQLPVPAGRGTVKVGRFPIPRGIYSATRIVGTVLPFYRASSFMYMEGFETLDGASVSYTTPDFFGFTVEADAYYGGVGLSVVVRTPTDASLFQAHFERAMGSQVWVNTPIEGVRVGANVTRLPPGIAGTAGSDRPSLFWLYSADATFKYVDAKAELYSQPLAGYGDTRAYYGLVSVKPTEAFSINATSDVTQGKLPIAPGFVSRVWGRDLAFGANYRISSQVVVKLEQHEVKGNGSTFDTFIAPNAAASHTHFRMASISVAF